MSEHRSLGPTATARVALAIALRELRGGLRGFRVFLACLSLGVAAIAAVGSVQSSISTGLAQEARSLLGGDAEMRFTYRYADADEQAWMQANARRISATVDFRSMVTTGPAGEVALVQVRGVDGNYPLVGAVTLDPPMPIAEALETRDGMPGLVAEQVLLDRLGIAPGAVLRLGTQDFHLRAAIIRAPDGTDGGFSLGPRVILRTEALAASGLLGDGTLFNSAYRLLLQPDLPLAATARDAKALFADAGLRWRDRRNATPGLDRFIERMGSFLTLVGLAALAVGGVGIATAVRAYLAGKTETIATLKTLGASGNMILVVYLAQIGAIAVLGIALGLGIGAVIPLALEAVLAAQLPVPVAFDVYLGPLAKAGFFGLLVVLIFTLAPLARARTIRAAGLFRDLSAPDKARPAKSQIALIALLVAILVGGAALWSGYPPLALWTAAGILAAMAALALAGRGTRALARWSGRRAFIRGKPSLRLALGSIAGPEGATVSVIVSLGLGLTVLAAVGQIDGNLRRVISKDLPTEVPAFFFVDIQRDQLDAFSTIVAADPAVTNIETAPMLRGMVTKINGRAAREVAGEHWVLHGDRGVSFAATTPPRTNLTEGEWWAADHSGPPEMSLAAEEAFELGLTLGDQMTVAVLGREITATITSLREVNYRDMGINFVMILNPAALAGAPHTNIATVTAAQAGEGRLLRSVATALPNVTAIGVRDAITLVSEALNGIAAATRLGALVTILSGGIVLIGAAAAGADRRVFEAAVLKTLGATRARILAGFALSAALLGAAAASVAIIAGGLAGWAVIRFVMKAEFVFEWQPALIIVVCGTLASLLAGLLYSLRPLALRPAQVLQMRQ